MACLEHADRARQRADLVAARAVGNGDRVALRDLFGHARDLGERTDHGAPEDQRADRGEQDREHAEHAHQPGGEIDPGVDLGVGLPRLLGVERAKHLEVLVQRDADGAIGVVVAPFAAGSLADLGAEPRQLLAEFDELPDAPGERLELRGVAPAAPCAPRR